MPRRGCRKTWRRLRALEAEVAQQRQREARQAEALEAEMSRREEQQQHVAHLEIEVATLRDQLPRPVPPQPEPGPDNIDVILARVVHFVSGACHLVLGDSIARDAKLQVAAPDTLLNLSTGGNNFHKLASNASEKIARWKEHCRTIGQRPGRVIIWCGGNDVYGGRGLDTEDVRRAVLACGAADVLGPTPRVKGRMSDPPETTWRNTRAYSAEARIAAAVTELPNAMVVRHLGRQFCSGSQHKLGGRQGMFADDGVHVSAAGYRRLAVRLTSNLPWLQTGH